MVNIIGSEARAYGTSIHSSSENSYKFVSQDISFDDIFRGDAPANIVPAAHYSVIQNYKYSKEYIYYTSIPQVYRDVIAFDIDNLSTLGRKPSLYYVYLLRKIRI